MKKYTKCLFIMFGIILGFVFYPSVVQAETLDMNYSGYWYERTYTDGTPNRSFKWNIYEFNGEVAYCIEQNILEGENYTQGSWEQTGLPNTIKERLLLIGYYGYTYPGHQTMAYRAATQGLIWDTIIGKGSNTTFWTERYGKRKSA